MSAARSDRSLLAVKPRVLITAGALILLAVVACTVCFYLTFSERARLIRASWIQWDNGTETQGTTTAVVLSFFSKPHSVRVLEGSLSPAAAEWLVGVAEIEHLDLGPTPCDDAVLQTLAAHTGLRSITLTLNQFSVESARLLAGMPHLETLSIRDATVEEHVVTALAGSSSLQDLGFESCSLKAGDASAACAIPGISIVQMRQCVIDGCTDPAATPHATAYLVDLSDTAFDECWFDTFSQANSTQVMSLEGVRVTAHVVDVLLRNRQLKLLILERATVSESDLKRISHELTSTEVDM